MTQGNNEAIMGRLHIMAWPHVTSEQNERRVQEWKYHSLRSHANYAYDSITHKANFKDEHNE